MWVVLGGKQPGVHSTRPFISSTPKPAKETIFAVEVKTIPEQVEVLSLLPFLSQRPADESKLEFAKWLATSEDVRRILQHVVKFYAVASGKFIGIYQEWDDVEPLVNGTYSLFRKFPKLGTAMAYTVLQPSSAALKTTYANIFGEYAGETVGVHLATEAMSISGTTYTSSTIASSPKCMLPLEKALSDLRFEDGNIPKYGRVSPVKHLTTDTKLKSTITTRSIVAPSVREAKIIQQHVRNFECIQESRFLGAPLAVADNIPRPPLGAPAESYLRAHGYDLPSQLQLAYAYQSCDYVHEFVDKMSGFGMTVMESEWLWDEIVRGMAK